MNRYQKIKNMNVDEMAEYFSDNNEFVYTLGFGLRAYLDTARNTGKRIPFEEEHKIQVKEFKSWLLEESEEQCN